ncbi:MAG: hypothetical protein K5798_08725 [Nitrosopumilus sp.]|uniref:hypothetical protein n=1 Tax=Nitrosopumilus sp. TaxID=2024843 RepID=UPI0024309BC8|nr:hypothetical protein [Nitrosopumilus sp.]MCV0367326.1 hypothetical protein [Nitrosopumilus sp.]
MKNSVTSLLGFIIALLGITLSVILDEIVIVEFDLNQIDSINGGSYYVHTENGKLINNYRSGAIFPSDKITYKTDLVSNVDDIITVKPTVKVIQAGTNVTEPVEMRILGFDNKGELEKISQEFFVGREGRTEIIIEYQILNNTTQKQIDLARLTSEIEVLSLSDKLQSDQNYTLLVGIIVSGGIGFITFLALRSSQKTAKNEVKQLEIQNDLMKTQNEQLQKQFKEQIKLMNVDVHSKTMSRIFELLTNPEMKKHKQKVANGYWSFKNNNEPAIFSTGSASISASIVKQAFDQACLLYELGLVDHEQFLAVYGGTVVRFWKILEDDVKDDQRHNPEICKFFQTVAQKFIHDFNIVAEPYDTAP